MPWNKYKHHYTLNRDFDLETYHSYRDILNKIPGITAEKELEDVDGSLIQLYMLNGSEIKLTCSDEVGAVYVDSNVNIDAYVLDVRENEKAYKVI